MIYWLPAPPLRRVPRCLISLSPIIIIFVDLFSLSFGSVRDRSLPIFDLFLPCDTLLIRILFASMSHMCVRTTPPPPRSCREVPLFSPFPRTCVPTLTFMTAAWMGSDRKGKGRAGKSIYPPHVSPRSCSLRNPTPGGARKDRNRFPR